MELSAWIQVILELWGSLFCVVILLSLLLDKRTDPSSKKYLVTMELFTALLLVADSVAWIFHGYPGKAGYVAVRISNFLVFATSYVILIGYTLYLRSKLPQAEQQRMKKWVLVITTFCILETIVLIANCFVTICYYFDAENVYHRAGAGYYLILLPGLIADIIDFILLLRNRKNLSRANFLSLGSFIILPGIALGILIFFYGISLSNIAILLSMLFMALVSYREYYEMALKQEKELSELRERILISQIGPHFVYNCLSTIRHLCRVDPEQAAEAITEFSNFLRADIDALQNDNCIPFEEELEHVQNYLALEQRRFGEKVHVVWNIGTCDFQVPPLSLQPIVENAVKHGITKKVAGGTIQIGTWKGTDGCYHILVEDDGVGFEEDKKTAETGGHRSPHIGIDNVRNRLRMMCDGRITVTGKPGEGTRAEILIPVSARHKERKRHPMGRRESQ